MAVLYFLLSFGLFQVVSTELTIRGDVKGVSFANFKKHQGRKLSGTPLKTIGVEVFEDCLFECNANTRCLSTNVNTTSDGHGLFECVLLGFDRHKHPDNFSEVAGVDHYVLPSKCDDKPCKHNEKCIALYANNSYRCECLAGTKGKHCEIEDFHNCAQRLTAGYNNSGVYVINATGNATQVQVYCDMVTSGGGWTVIQKRLGGSVDFYRAWDDYKKGFGNKLEEYWLGLDTIHAMTSQGSYRLRVDMEDFEGNTRYAEYDSFNVADEADNYRLTVGGFTGDAGDSLSSHNGQQFTTKDRDNDVTSANCAVSYAGAWWYETCLRSNLNGRYLHGATNEYAKGVVWFSWKGYNYSLKRVEMKIRPKEF